MSLNFTEIATFVQTKEILSTTVNHLNKWGCCARCILRFLGVKVVDVYRVNDIASLRAWVSETSTGENIEEADKKDIVTCSELNGVVNISPSSMNADGSTDSCKPDVELKRNSESEILFSCSEETICTTCLGILEKRYCCPAFIDGIASAVRQQEFEYDNFLCSISVPVSLLLREYGTLLALCHHMPSVFEDVSRDSITPIKDVWKWVNGPHLASALKCPFDQKSPFEIVISFVYAQDEVECKFLYGLQPHIFRKRKKNQKQMQSVDVFNRANVSRAINECSREAYRRAYKCPPSRSTLGVTVSPILCQHAAIYIAGRYTRCIFVNFYFHSFT